ncbi:hypothetical protein HGRIS_000523 [Hohenbuehelia grisea]|uniref:F-box protein n=1 Tax=Hohenbuehelia grisea TaxID=104357 RepID=A0ABR3JRG6_9AGAR
MSSAQSQEVEGLTQVYYTNLFTPTAADDFIDLCMSKGAEIKTLGISLSAGRPGCSFLDIPGRGPLAPYLQGLSNLSEIILTVNLTFATEFEVANLRELLAVVRGKVSTCQFYGGHLPVSLPFPELATMLFPSLRVLEISHADQLRYAVPHCAAPLLRRLTVNWTVADPGRVRHLSELQKAIYRLQCHHSLRHVYLRINFYGADFSTDPSDLPDFTGLPALRYLSLDVGPRNAVNPVPVLQTVQWCISFIKKNHTLVTLKSLQIRLEFPVHKWDICAPLTDLELTGKLRELRQALIDMTARGSRVMITLCLSLDASTSLATISPKNSCTTMPWAFM